MNRLPGYVNLSIGLDCRLVRIHEADFARVDNTIPESEINRLLPSVLLGFLIAAETIHDVADLPVCRQD